MTQEDDEIWGGDYKSTKEVETKPKPRTGKKFKDTTDDLIGQQKEAYQDLIKFVEGAEPMFCFEGYAGVGKTYLVSKFTQRQINIHNSSICLCAPTHKAKSVMIQMATTKSDNIEYSTVHALLGLKPVITDEGKESFVRDKKTKNSVGDYDIIIIDEASMLDHFLFGYLYDELDNHPFLKIVFVGDSKQLPPVGRVASIPMDERYRERFGIGHTVLTQIVRQKGANPIIQLSKEIREGKFEPKTNKIDGLCGIIVVGVNRNPRAVNKDENILLKNMFCTGKYEENPNYCRVVAWRNETVNYYNNKIRNMIYHSKVKASYESMVAEGKSKAEMSKLLKREFPFYDTKTSKMDLPRYVKGEKVIVDKPIFDIETGKQVIAHTNEELIIEDYVIEYVSFMGEDYRCYLATVKNEFTGTVNVIEAVHEDSLELYEKNMNTLKEAALRAGKGVASRQRWTVYYEMDKRFARLKYAPALTTYKSQGSTYENIIVIADDIYQNPKVRERLQHLYVGVTRASKRAFITVPVNRR